MLARDVPIEMRGEGRILFRGRASGRRETRANGVSGY